MLVEKGAVQALDDAVGLRTTDAGSLVLDAFQLAAEFVAIAVVAAAELTAIVAEHGVDPGRAPRTSVAHRCS